ncbi:formylglycine-generating enzyme family protein [Kitasatospora sp. NPDC087861]|uniref:formylglycine-generating enzyme family protein n=1 Tax=Kitasatospora sp. NPDC087861 TaxID=3364070 RepID=UPI0038185184
MDVSTGMITVPSGRVTLSDRRTQRSWSVDLAPYELAACPVTREQYGAGAGDRYPADSVSWYDAVHYCNELSRRDGFAPAYRLDGESVSWDRAADGYRLPTEAEWEHACRAGTDGPRYGPLDEIAWHRGNSGERPHDVGGLRPNGFGLYDLLGNVWEWCWDVYDAEVYGGYRVLRGGGWFDEHWSCRASVRRRSHPTLRIDDVGFRLARSITV